MPAESVTPAIPTTLNLDEARVLGCLIEKENTLPDYYPMTLNALVSACNQSTNRDPIMQLDERSVRRALESMKTKGYVFQVTIVGGRVEKYRHNLKARIPDLDLTHVSILCMLLLRGKQTAGELRQRTERLYNFPDMPAVESALAELIGYRSGPLIQCYPAGPGQRVAQYDHLFCGEAEAHSPAQPMISAPPPAPLDDEADWRAKMEAEITLLKAQISRLQDLVGAVR